MWRQINEGGIPWKLMKEICPLLIFLVVNLEKKEQIQKMIFWRGGIKIKEEDKATVEQSWPPVT